MLPLRHSPQKNLVVSLRCQRARLLSWHDGRALLPPAEPENLNNRTGVLATGKGKSLLPAAKPAPEVTPMDVPSDRSTEVAVPPMTPENTGLIGANRADTLDKAQTEETHGMLATARASARDTGAWFLLGSIHVRVPGEEQIRNRSYLIDSSGGIVASYDKIHMFDVELSGVGGQSYRESSTFKPGEHSVLAETPWGTLGMTICYDLRFPYLYRDLAHAGATMLSIPSSFTVPTYFPNSCRTTALFG